MHQTTICTEEESYVSRREDNLEKQKKINNTVESSKRQGCLEGGEIRGDSREASFQKKIND